MENEETEKIGKQKLTYSKHVKPNRELWFWVDIEMSGLDKDALLLEIGIIVTDIHLNVVDTFELVVFHSQKELESKLSPWCKSEFSTRTMHEPSLIENVLQSNVSVEKAGRLIEAFFGKHLAPRKKAVLAGSSVGFDRAFLLKTYPYLEEKIHYRIIDVSSVLLLCKSWYPQLDIPERTSQAHRALADIQESLQLMHFFKSFIFVPATLTSGPIPSSSSLPIQQPPHWGSEYGYGNPYGYNEHNPFGSVPMNPILPFIPCRFPAAPGKGQYFQRNSQNPYKDSYSGTASASIYSDSSNESISISNVHPQNTMNPFFYSFSHVQDRIKSRTQNGPISERIKDQAKSGRDQKEQDSSEQEKK